MTARSELVLAENLTFPAVEAATQRHAWIAGSGGGKTYGCGRFVEQLYAAAVPSLIFDTVGVWSAIRLAADGKSPGLPFVVFGGLHADVPLDLKRGSALAEALVKSNACAVIDVSNYLQRERADFAADFFERLFLAVQSDRRPRMLVLDEAYDVAPERARAHEQRLLVAAAQLVRKGRNYRLGTCQVTQRPQSVHKEVLNLAESAFFGVLRTKHERQAAQDWVAFKSRDESVLGKLEALPTFKPGEFLFYSPSWLERLDRVRILPKWTFDGSSSTPLDAEIELGKLAPVDVEALRALLAPKAEPASAEPNGAKPPGWDALCAENNQLRDELDQAREELAALRAKVGAFEQRSALIRDAQRALEQALDWPPETSDPPALSHGPGHVLGTPVVNGKGQRVGTILSIDRAVEEPATETGELDGYAENVLASMKAYGPLTPRQLAIVAGVSPISSTFSTTLRKFQDQGWAQKARGELIANPDAVTGKPKLTRGSAVRNFWLNERLDAYSAKLVAAAASLRHAVPRKELARLAGVSPISSTYSSTLATLKRGALLAADGTKIGLSPEARWAMLL